METADLDSSALDLKMPDNIRQEVEYQDSLDVYYSSKLFDITKANTSKSK